MYGLKKYLRIGPYGLCAAGLIVFASLLRIAMLAQSWPASNSDEATMGLMALHIARGKDFPVFFYGQSYMGSLEALLAAPLFQLAGPSVFTLRVGMVLLFALFLVVVYLLASLLYSPGLGLLSLALLSLGSSEMFTRQLKAVGGALETCLFGALVFLFALWLALSFVPGSERGFSRGRWWLYVWLGCVAGIGLWSHMLTMPFELLAFGLLLLCCRPELGRYTVRALLPGLVLGLLPLLVFNVQHPAQNSLVTLWQLHSAGGSSQSSGLTNLPWQWNLPGTLVVSIPMTTGANPLCPMSSTPGAWSQNLQFSCISFQAAWGCGYLVLLLLASVFAIRSLQRSGWLVPLGLDQPRVERRAQVIRLGRLMLLGSALLTLLAYISSPGPALVPITSERYLVGFLVATPSVLAPVWYFPRWLSRFKPKLLPLLGQLVRAGLLLFVAGVLLQGTISVFRQGPEVQADLNKHNGLIQYLEDHHIKYFFTDYWHCNRLIFQSQEQVICSVLNADLTPGQNRYPLYPELVAHASHPAYVFSTDSPQAVAFVRQAADKGLTYRQSHFLEFVIFQP